MPPLQRKVNSPSLDQSDHRENPFLPPNLESGAVREERAAIACAGSRGRGRGRCKQAMWGVGQRRGAGPRRIAVQQRRVPAER